jgi:hypothetical protein
MEYPGHLASECIKRRFYDTYTHRNTGLFMSPYGISDLYGTVTGMVTPKGNMSTEGETLQVSVLPYKCSMCPPLVTRQMSNLAILANFKTQNAFYSLSTPCFVTTAPLR